eukprot:1873393-Prorocentrum_lima.AAC.1
MATLRSQRGSTTGLHMVENNLRGRFPRWSVVGGIQREGRTLPPYTAPGLGPETKGSNHVTRGRWLNFDGTRWHE